MLLIYLASYHSRDLINDLTTTDIKRLMNENISFSQFVKKDMQLFRHATEIIIERKICRESDAEMLELLGQFRLLYDTRVIVYCSGAEPAFIKSLLSLEIFDVVTATELDPIREQFTAALNGGMSLESWYDTFPELKPVPAGEDRAVAAPDDAELLTAARATAVASSDNITVAFAGAMPHSGTTRLAIDFATFLSNLGAKVAFVDAKGRILSALQENFSCNVIDGRILNCHNIDFMAAMPKGEYNFSIIDTGGASKLWDRANITVLCATYSFYEQEAVLESCTAMRPHILIGNLVSETQCQKLADLARFSTTLRAKPSGEFFSESCNENAGIFCEITDACIERAAEREAEGSIDENLQRLLEVQREEFNAPL